VSPEYVRTTSSNLPNVTIWHQMVIKIGGIFPRGSVLNVDTVQVSVYLFSTHFGDIVPLNQVHASIITISTRFFSDFLSLKRVRQHPLRIFFSVRMRKQLGLNNFVTIRFSG
jgi:hypothetical protein